MKASDNEYPSILLVEQSSKPTAPAAGRQRLYLKTDHKVYHEDHDENETEVGGGGAGAGIYPQHASVFVDEFNVVTGCGGSLVFHNDANQCYQMYVYQTTPGNGDVIQTTILLKAGIYNFNVLGITYSNEGKLDWSIDSEAPFISAQDWYGVGFTENIVKTGTLTISDTGRHLLKATINGKNGSSGNYQFLLTKIWLAAQTESSET